MFSDLPYLVRYQILLQMSRAELANTCSIDASMAEICENSAFRKEYLKLHPKPLILTLQKGRRYHILRPEPYYIDPDFRPVNPDHFTPRAERKYILAGIVEDMGPSVTYKFAKYVSEEEAKQYGTPKKWDEPYLPRFR